MRNTISPSCMPLLPRNTFHKEIELFHIITHPTKPSWAVVNPFGWEVLKLCDGRNTIQDIINIIRSQYDVPREIADKDISSFISSITKSGILQNSEMHDVIPDTPIQSIFFHLTDKCNLHCKHCYAKNMSKGETEISDNEIYAFLDKFFTAEGKGLVLSGGEPLLRNNFKRIIELKPDAQYTLLTNATLINDEYASFFSRHNISIQVSIDGSNAAVHDTIRGDGSFNAAITGIECLIKRGLARKINLCTTVMNQNINDLPNIFDLASSLGIPFVRFLPLRKKGNARTNWENIQGELTARDYEKFYSYVFDTAMSKYPNIDIRCGLSGFILDSKKLMNDGNWCPLGKNIVVDTKGNVYPCSLLMDDKFRIGNIKKNSIEEIKSHPVLLDLIAARSLRKNKIKRCISCMWKNFCQSSCMGSIYDQGSTIYDTDDFCDFRIRLYEKSVLKLAQCKSLSKSYLPHGDSAAECY